MKMFMIDKTLRKYTPIASTLLAGLLCATAAFAGNVSTCAALSFGPTPGNSVFPTNCTGDTAGTLDAWMSSPFSYTTTSGVTSGFVYSAVYNDGGTLDFYYQVVNNASSSDALSTLAVSNFALASTTNGAYRTDGSSLTGTGFVNGTVAPLTVNNYTVTSPTKETTIQFVFYPPSSSNTEIAPGDTSYVEIVSTNATKWTAGNAAVIDSGTATVAAFQPGSGVPEPASLGLLGLGLVGLAGLRRRRVR